MAVLTDSEVIDELGGTGAVAELCDVGASAVSQWRTDGIPPARRIQLAEELRRLGKRIPKGFYERSVPAPRGRSAPGGGAPPRGRRRAERGAQRRRGPAPGRMLSLFHAASYAGVGAAAPGVVAEDSILLAPATARGGAMLSASARRLKTATQRLVDRVGGLAEAAKNARPDFRRFSDYQSFTRPERFIPADAVADLERAVGDPVVTRELAELAGFDLVRRPSTGSGAGAADPASCLRRLTAELGDVARAEERAVAHVRQSANDARETVDELQDLISCARAMIDAIERGALRGSTAANSIREGRAS